MLSVLILQLKKRAKETFAGNILIGSLSWFWWRICKCIHVSKDCQIVHFKHADLFFVNYVWTQLLNFKKMKVALVVKNPPASAGDIRDAGSIPGSGRSPGGEHGNPLQYSCLENPKDRGAWRALVHGVSKISTQLKWFSTQHNHD